MVGDAALGKIVGADALRAVARAHLKAAAGGILAVLLLALKLVQAGLEHAHGLFPILNLAALILTGDHQSRGQMGDAHGGVGAVDVLAARAGGAIGVDAQLGGVDADLHVLGLGQHGHRGGGGVDAAGGLGDGHALHAVHAGLVLELLEHVAPLNEQRALLHAAQLGGAVLDELGLPAVAVGVMGVHAQKLRGEQPGLVAARARAHLQHGVARIVRIPGQQHDARPGRQVGELRFQLADLLAGQLGHVGILQHLPRAGELLQRPSIFRGQIVHLAQLAVLAHQPRERRRVGDDLRAGDLHRQLLIACLDALQLARDALLFVIAALH